MKKVLIASIAAAVAVIAAVVAVVCVCCLGNCGGNDEETYKVTTITESEFKPALTAVYGLEHSVYCEMSVSFEDEDSGEAANVLYHYWFDVTSKSNHVYCDLGDGKDNKMDFYIWQGSDGKYYEVSHDSSALKCEITKEEYEEKLREDAEIYTGESVLPFIVENFNFTDFTYDEVNKAYQATYRADGADELYALQFGDGKLVKFTVVGKEMTVNCTFKYNDIEVTIPNDILNMPATQN